MNPDASYEQTIERIREVRALAIEHTRKAQALVVERRDLMRSLIRNGHSQSAIARESGVTRQAVRKMMSI